MQSNVPYSTFKDSDEGTTNTTASPTSSVPMATAAPALPKPTAPMLPAISDSKSSSVPAASAASASGISIHPARKIGVELSTVVKESPFKLQNYLQKNDNKKIDPHQAQIEAVIKEFNIGITKSGIVESYARGSLLSPGQLFMVEKNGRPELALPGQKYLARELNVSPSIKVNELPSPNLTDIQIGKNGHYLLNVPPGKYLLAYINNEPVIYAEGFHVVHNSTFRLKDPTDVKKSCVEKNQEHIHHGEGNYQIHILQMQRNKYAKILDGQDQIPEILEHRDTPYVFTDSYFQLITPKDYKPENEKSEAFFDINASYISHRNHHKLRVPSGKIAKVLLGPSATPAILVAGEHDFDDPYFKIVDEKDAVIDPDKVKEDVLFCDANKDYICHRTIHIIRNKPGEIALVTHQNQQKVLLSASSTSPNEAKNFFTSYKDKAHFTPDEKNPQISKIVNEKMEALYHAYPNAHIVNDRSFELISPEVGLLDQKHNSNKNIKSKYTSETELYIRHGNKHILRIPNGQYAKVWRNGNAEILVGTHHITDSTFYVVDASPKQLFGSLTEPYIAHGDLFRLQVPGGKLAQVWVNGKGKLVSNQDKLVDDAKSDEKLLPGFFRHQSFQLEPYVDPKTKETTQFVDASQKVISFGGHLRVNPSSDEVAILSRRAGKDNLPEVVKPIGAKGGKDAATIIEDASVSVRGWFRTTAIDFNYPTPEKVEKNRAAGKGDKSEYEAATTADKKEVGVKLFVQVQIREEDAAIAADNFKDEKTAWAHVEKTTHNDVITVLTTNNYDDIMKGESSHLPKKLKGEDAKGEEAKVEDGKDPGSATLLVNKLRKELRDHLKEKGLTLTNLGITDPQILDEKVREQMREANSKSAQLSVEAANLTTNTTIEMATAKREADKKQIGIDQTNRNLIAQKNAELQTAEADAKVQVAKAKAVYEKAKCEADAAQYAKTIGFKAEQENELKKAETEAAKIRAIAQAKNDAAMMEISAESKRLENKLREKQIEVEAENAKLRGLADAYAISPMMADVDRSKFVGPMYAAALQHQNPINPQDFSLLMWLMNQSNAMTQVPMQTTVPVALPTTAAASPLSTMSLFGNPLFAKRSVVPPTAAPTDSKTQSNIQSNSMFTAAANTDNATQSKSTNTPTVTPLVANH